MKKIRSGAEVSSAGSYPEGQWFESILLHYYKIIDIKFNLIKIFKKNSI